MKKIIYILSIFVIASCTKDAKIKLPEVKVLPVVSCFISPSDTMIRLTLTKSKPIFEVQTSYNIEPIPDAIVKIYSVNGPAILNYNTAMQLYELDTQFYPVLFSETYTITIELADGSTAQAETTVPSSKVSIAGVSYETIEKNNATFDRHRIWFNDNGSETNYYRMAARDLNSTMPGDTTIYETALLKLFNDASKNGGEVDVYYDFFSQNYQGSGFIGRDYYILNCDKNYYLFHSSVERYNQNGGENPFVEPTIIYSNIKGGLGAFGAYTISYPYRKFK